MSPKNYSSDLARFGQPLSFGSLVGNAPTNPVLEAKSAAVNNKVEQSKQTIEMSAGAKALMFGSPEQQRVVATAAQNNNSLADEQVRDLRSMSYIEVSRKYGPEVAANLGNVARADQQLSWVQNAERTGDDVAKDTALDVAGGLASTAGGTLALGAEALDWAVDLPGRAINTALGTELVPNVPSAGPAISATTQQARDFLQEQQSPLLQAKREQMAIVNELDAVDRNEDFEGEEGVIPWFRKQGRAAFETVENYVEDPAMFGSVSAEGLGSLAIPTKLINSAGKVAAMRELGKKGLTRKEAQAHLKTDDGKALLNRKRLAAVSPVSSIVEGGGAVTQAQQEILAMDEATLRESAEYNALREKMGHEEARYELASDGGKTAAIVGTILGGVTGRFSRQFEVSPLGLPGTGKLGSSIAKGAKTGALETLEEGAQEGSNQVAANAGIASIGLDRDLDEGLGEAVGEGFVGGAGMVGLTAGPAAAAGTVAEVGRGIKSSVVTAVENANQKIKDGGATGLNAQMDAAVSIAKADTDIAAIPETERVAPVELVQAQDKASYLSVEESAAVVQAFPALKSEGTDDRVSRASLVVALSDALGSAKTPEERKPRLAIGLIESYDQLRQLGSDKAQEQIKSLPEGSQERTLYESKLEALKIAESNGAMKQAKEMIGKLTETDMRSMLDFSDIDQGKFDTDKSRSILETLEVVGRYKPQSVKPEDYSRVQNQVKDEATRERLETSKALVTSFAKAYEGREKLGFTEAQKQTRQDIYFNNNHTNSGKSLVAHNADVMETHRAGKTQDALDNLTELYEFARSQSNKIQGMNESKNEYNGKPVPFESWNPNAQTRFMQDAKGQMTFLVPDNEVSVRNAIETTIDANLAGELYNTLYERLRKDLTAEQMGNFEPITITALDLPQATPVGDYTIADILQTAAEFDPTTQERRLRRDAVLKNNESLIDKGTKPARVITQSEKRKLVKRAGGKQPFTQLLASMGGIDPTSPLGVELRQGRKLSRGDLPGLFKPNGQSEFDNLPAENYDPLLVAEIGTDDNGYLNFDGIVEALVKESTGQSVITTSDMLDARESLAAVEEQESQNEQTQNEVAEAEDAIALRGLEDAVVSNEELSNDQVQSNPKEEATESSQDKATSVVKQSAETIAAESGTSRTEESDAGSTTTAGTGEPSGSTGQSDANTGEASTESSLKSDVIAEINDLATLMNLTGIPIQEGTTVVPDTATLQENIKDLMTIFNRLEKDPISSLKDYEARIRKMMSWIKSDIVQDNQDREARAKKNAAKLGDSGYVIQMVEELVEVIEVNDSKADAKALEIQKREVKILRFGADTVIKQDGPYKGMTNQQALEVAKAPKPKNKPTMKEILVDLVKNSVGLNYFLEVFRLKSRDVSLLAQDSPFSYAIEQTKMSDNARSVMQAFARKDMPELKGKLDAYLTKQFNAKRNKDHKGDSLAESWANGKDVLKYESAHILNMGQITDNKITMDPKLFSAGMMATIEWLIKADATGITKPSDKNLAKFFGLASEADVTTQHRSLYLKGSKLQNAVDEISQGMENLLGVEADQNQPVLFTQGMFRNAVTSILQVMDQENLLTVNSDAWTDSYYGPDGKPVMYFTVTLNKKGPFKEKFLDGVKGYPDLFKSVYAPDTLKTRYIGKPPSKLTDAIIRQKSNKLSRTQRKAVERLQKVKHNIVVPMFQLSESMDERSFLKLFGFEELEGKVWNVADRTAIEGRNRNLADGLKGVRGYVEQMREQYDDDDFSTPIFFDWFISSVGRLQQQGPITPQGSKVARELISATQSVLDLNNPEHMEALKLAIYQSMDLKIGIEKQSTEASIAKIDALIESDYAKVIQMMESWVKTGDINGPALVEAFDEAGIEKSAKAVHAMMTVARMNFYVENQEDVSAFETSLALEYDGKTDGPINAMINMASGLFTPHQIKVMAKGGLLLGVNQPVSLNDYIGGNDALGLKGDDVDLYILASEMLETNLYRDIQNTDVPEEMNAALRTLSAFSNNFDFRYDSDGLDISVFRNMVKNPLTVFIYGSSENGIAGKIAAEVMGNLRKTMSEVADAVSRDEYGSYVEHPAFKGTGLADILKSIDPDVTKLLENPETETGDFFATSLTNLFNLTIAEPMIEALDDATGGLRANMQLLQATASVQAYIFSDVYTKMLEEKKAELGVKGSRNLSESMLREVFEEASKVAPIYVSEAQEFRVAEADGYTSEETVSTGMNGKLASGADLPRPGNPSVKISPFLIIGTGDGMMMMNIYTGELQDFDRNLPVFDGIEDNLENIKRNAEYINQKVLDGWLTEDVPGMALRSFNQTIRYLRNGSLSKETTANIAKTYKSLNKSRQNQKGAKFIRSHKDLHGELTTMTGENKARKKAMSTFSMSGDHMAGANAPAFRDGTRVGSTGYDPQAVSDAINTVYLEIRNEQRKDAQAKQRAPATATFEKGFGKRLMNISTETGISGTRRVQGDALVEVLEKSNLSSEQEQVFLDVMRKDPAFKEYSFIFGSSENVTAVRDRDFPNLKDHNGNKPGPVQMGQVITDKKVAYISNVSTETVLHEILHTYTAQRIEDYYADTKEGKHIPAYMVQAFTRLEKLMADFRSMTFDQVTNNAEDKAGLLLQRVLDNAENDPVGQMSEFLSWTMSNQNLINIGKETEVRSPLAKIAYTAVRLLKRILGIQGDPGTNMFSNIRFNMDVISNLPVVENLAEEDARTRTIFDQVYGTDDNLTELENKYMTRLKAYLSRISDTPAAEQRRVVELLQQADKAIVGARAVGFTLNDREAATFRAIHATMASGMQLNGSVLRQVKRAYAVALKEAPDNAQWGFLAGRGGARQTKAGQTDLLATFAALAQVNNVLRADLAKIDTPNIQTETNPNMGTVDQWMKWAGDQIVNWLTKLSISRKPLGNTAQMQLDALAGALVEIEDGRRLKAEELVYKASNAVNEKLADGIEKVSRKTSRKLQDMRSGIKTQGAGKYINTGLEIASLITAFGSKTEMAGKIKTMEEHMNKTPKLRELRALMNDFVGVTDENAETLKIMNQVRSEVDAVRQEYREQVPEVLASKFNRKLNNDEWTEVQRAVGYTDAVALGIDETLALMKDPSTLPTMKRQLEAEVNNLGGNRAVRYKQKARVLAKNLANGTKASNNMQRNAYAIAKLAGETNREMGKVDEKLVKAIDKLTSLYAYEELTPEQKDKMKDLMETEPTGMRFVIGYQDTVRGLENHRLGKMNNAGAARINGYKGHSSTIIRDGHAIVVADDADGEDLRRKGYERVGSYYGDGSEKIDNSVGYYVSTVGGKAAFRQGTMQTVHETWNGVDPRTGFTQNKPMGGVIKGRKAQRVLSARGPVRDNLDSKEALMPVYDESGKTIAFERSIDPEKMEHLQVDEHMGRMLGVGMGRLFEEDLANKFNMVLLQEMKKNYDIGVREGTLDQFVNIAESDDPIHKDIWRTMGVRLKDDAAAIFGETKMLPVKRNMELDTVGYRAGSVREVWDDDSRMNKTFQKAFQDALVLPFGEKAYKRAVQAETLVQDAVSYAKTTIVVRSVVVMKENLVSNVLHLMSWGIGPVQALKGIITKFLETNQYVKNRERILELNAELAATGQNRKARERISAQIKVLTDIEKNLSIYPLIAAGEFNTISESLTEADTAIANGKLSNLIEQYADRLPGLARDAVKTLMITRDSALFKALNRAVQYGDFTAKAVLYDHLTDQQNMDPDAAMKVITEEFVNYNRLSGRGRDYAESMGMLWFTSYKIRIMKILAKMARERPASALLYGAGVGPWLDIDTVASGSLIGSVADGGFSYAVGPEMGIDSLSMNPFWGGMAN